MKFMNMKRFASTVLAGTMALSLAVPAMAEDQTTVITATYADTDLEVTVPATAAATINPYGLPVTLEDATTVLSGQPITIATPLMIENQSSVALKVGANVKAEVTTGMTLEAAATGVAGDPAKKLHVNFQAFETSIGGADTQDPTKTNPAWAALKDADAVLTATLADSTTAANGVDAGGSKDLVLREGKDGLSQAGGVAFVRLSGVVAKKPTTAWATTDKLTTTITYSFEPAAYSKSAGTIADINGLQMGATLQANVTFTSALPTGVTATTTTWTSSDENVLTVAADGSKVQAVSAGTATISVTIVGSDGITYTATSNNITVAAP